MRTVLALILICSIALCCQASEPVITASKGVILAVPTKKTLNCEYQLAVTVKNGSKSALEEIAFYVRLKEPKRTVPHADALLTVKIQSGIEPGETKQVLVKIPGSKLDVDFFQAEQMSMPLEITVALQASDDKKKLREIYANNKFATVPLEVQKSDPNVDAVLNLK